MKTISFTALAILALSLAACGGAGPAGAEGPEGPAGPQGQTGVQGPQGDSGAPGQNGVNGTQGAQGPQGVQGVPGPAGEAGANGDAIVSSIGCTGILANSGGFEFQYNVDQFADGNVFATGYVAGLAASISGSALYAPTQNGYQTAQIQFVMDVYAPTDGGWWTIGLNRSTLVTTITYHDADIVDSGVMSWTMLPSQCAVNKY